MSIDDTLAAMRARYAAARPRSRDLAGRAAAAMPGGNTRTVLHSEPFPMVIERAEGDMLHDVDGFGYVDCAGEFSAGLFGHSDPAVTAALHHALDDGIVLGAPNRYEAELAALLCARFPSLDLIRFCNSGTEANLFALMAARNATGRDRILAFEGAYHGGLLSFPAGGNPMNLPFDVVLAPYNAEDRAARLIRGHAASLAAIIVEPLLGAAGNIPAEPGFLAMLRTEADAAGAVLIFDEVKTSRLGGGGLQARYGVTPDMTTLGKYIGGGLPCGAFGGRRDIMERFDPRRPDALGHAGTFNNNVLTMAAGLAGMRDVYTPARAEAFLDRCERFRDTLAARLARSNLPFVPSGIGSILSLHTGTRAPRRVDEIDPALGKLRSAIRFECLERGLALTPRGDIYLSLPMEGRLDEITDILADAVAAVAAQDILPA